MACLNPLRAIRTPDGKVLIKKKAELLQTDLGNWVDTQSGEFFEPFDVPCGKCLPCRLAYARKWANRCLLEQKSWRDNWFVTFTYDDEHLHFGKQGFATLFPSDFTAFMKRLRAHYADTWEHDNIRFYMAAEYGDQTYRPHHHACAFNLPLDDLQFYSKSPLGDCYYISPLLTEKWQHGHVIVGELTEQSAAYTARYCQKKANKTFDYKAIDVVPEYVRMSRRPGIGAFYFEKNFQDIYEDDKVYLPNGKVFAPPRYFDTLAEKKGLDLERVKSLRLYRAQLREELNNQMCSVDYWQHMEDLEKSFEEKGRRLRRNL